VWRIARPFNGHVLRQVSEGDVGANVVLVFRGAGRGTTTLAFGLTVGETRKAYESRRFTVSVR
jgi:ATP:corrinoid adenosyltransferase